MQNSEARKRAEERNGTPPEAPEIPVWLAPKVEQIYWGLRQSQEVHCANWDLVPREQTDYSKYNILVMATAIKAEIDEVLGEDGWKPWRRETETEVPALLDELADMMIFVTDFVAKLQQRHHFKLRDLAEAIVAKERVNRERFLGNVPGREPPASFHTYSRTAALLTQLREYADGAQPMPLVQGDMFPDER